MAEQQEEHEKCPEEEEEEEEDDNPKYTAPAPKAMSEIINQDADDESLNKYKEALLGGNPNFIKDENNPNKVIIEKIALVVEGRPEVSIDLTKSKKEIEKESLTIKEGAKYKMRVYFFVQREIVSGLRYEHKVTRTGLAAEKMTKMMGSFGPKSDLQSCTIPEDTAPSGLLARGRYKVKSRFFDDDKNEFASWVWHLTVAKEWE